MCGFQEVETFGIDSGDAGSCLYFSNGLLKGFNAVMFILPVEKDGYSLV